MKRFHGGRSSVGVAWAAMLSASVLIGCRPPESAEATTPEAPPPAAIAAYVPRLGDLVFQSSPRGPLINAIEGATQSPYSHCGIVPRRDEAWVVVEAVEPVKETPLAQWIARGRQAGFAVYRFEEKYADKLPVMIAAARRHLGKPYDMRYDFDDEKLYCSELIYKAFREATGEECGAVCRLGELNWRPYETFIRMLEGGDLPLERRMITPRAVSEATQLKLVLRKGI